MAGRPGARAIAAAVTASVALTFCGCSAITPSTGGTAAEGKVIALTNMSVLRNIFNRDQGHARLVLIFSPT